MGIAKESLENYNKQKLKNKLNFLLIVNQSNIDILNHRNNFFSTLFYINNFISI